MSLPVIVERENGKFVASVLGHSALRAEGTTNDRAVAALRADLSARTASGELVWIDPLKPAGIPQFPPPTEEELEMSREVVAEIYRERDAQKLAEFPE